MNFKFILILLASAWHLAAQPVLLDQSVNSTYENIRLLLNKEKLLHGSSTMPYENMEGSPFLYKDFVKGKIWAAYGNFEAVPMNFDTYQGTFLCKIDGKTMYLDPQAQTHKVLIDSTVFVLRTFSHHSKSERLFVEQLYLGKLSLFAKKNILLKEAEAPKALIADAQPPRFVKRPDSYYLQLGNGSMVSVENFNHIAELFPALADTLKTKIKAEKLSFKKPDDLVALIKYCDESL